MLQSLTLLLFHSIYINSPSPSRLGSPFRPSLLSPKSNHSTTLTSSPLSSQIQTDSPKPSTRNRSYSHGRSTSNSSPFRGFNFKSSTVQKHQRSTSNLDSDLRSDSTDRLTNASGGEDWEWGQGQSSYQEISTFQDSDDEKQLQGPFMSPLFKRRGRKNTQDNGNGSHPPSSFKGIGLNGNGNVKELKVKVTDKTEEASTKPTSQPRRLSLSFLNQSSKDSEVDLSLNSIKPSKFSIANLSSLSRRRSSSGALPSQPQTPITPSPSTNTKSSGSSTVLGSRQEITSGLSLGDGEISQKDLSIEAQVAQTRINDFPSSPTFGNFLEAPSSAFEHFASQSSNQTKSGVKKSSSIKKKNSLERFQSKNKVVNGNGLGWEHQIPRNASASSNTLGSDLTGKLMYDPKRRPMLGGQKKTTR